MRGLRALVLLITPMPLGAQSGADYAGAEACAKCHAAAHKEWSASGHGRIFQKAGSGPLEGDFAQGRVVLHGSAYVLARRGADVFITESDLAGKQWEHRVDYVLGGRRMQQYLTTLPDGRIIVLPPSWDNVQKKWIHDVDARNPEESPSDLVPVWNKTCYSCHVTGARKNFEAAAKRYHTTWEETGAVCASCHGPGEEHAQKPARGNIVNPARLDATRSTMICAQCHSSRDIYAAGFSAGGDYFDAFLPVMEYRAAPSDDAAFWADGRPRWFANDATALWQSQCYLKGGASCTTCHDRSHSLTARMDPNTTCQGCHKAMAAQPTAHTHHAAKSAGSSCVECHMPPTVTGLNARMRDHSMSVPAPENSVAHGIPNACNGCHGDRDAAWAARQVTAWFGTKSRARLIRRADAFAQARVANPRAIPALLAIVADAGEGGWIRANAVGYLGSFPDDPEAYAAVLRAFRDEDALVRATASSAIRPRAAQREALAPQLAALLRDRVLAVRMNAGVALVSMGVRPFAGEDGARFEQAKELYRARAEMNNDDAGQQFAAGKFFFLAGDAERAATAFRAAMKLDPNVPAQFLLARSLALGKDFAGAGAILKAMARDNPDYAAAQQLLAEIEAKAGGGEADTLFRDGQLQYQSQYYGAALRALEQALQLSPEAEWAVKAKVYRAICLEKLGRIPEAESVIKTLLTDPATRGDVDLQLAYVELLCDTGRASAAEKQVDAAIGAAPNAPMAHFWRARVLLEEQRAKEAADAAEEAVRLQPELPQAHNLLVRIYQMLGRTKEAAQQAEWLRDYQRRLQSH